jgi:transcriptional regulator with XRE-family HTH domain
MALPAREESGDLVETTRAAIAAEVRSLMGRHRVTQTELAKELHMSQPALSRRLQEPPELPFTVDQLAVIARLFDTTVSRIAESMNLIDLTSVLLPSEQMELSFQPPAVLAGVS